MRGGLSPSRRNARRDSPRFRPTGYFGSVIWLLLLATLEAGCARQNGRGESFAADRKVDSAASQVIPRNPAGPASTGVQEADRWVPAAAPREWEYLVIHHTATDAGSVESIHATHRQRRDAVGNPWQGIGYHFVIGNGRGMDDGEIEATFRWRQQLAGAHAGVGDYNKAGIGICLVGNFESHPPTSKQLGSLRALIDVLCRQYAIPAQHVLRHGDVRATACPGRLFSLKDVVPNEDGPFLESPQLSQADR